MNVQYQILVGYWPCIIFAAVALIYCIWKHTLHAKGLSKFISNLLQAIYFPFLIASLLLPVVSSESVLTFDAIVANIVKLPLLAIIDGLIISIKALQNGSGRQLLEYITHYTFNLLIFMPFAYFLRRKMKTQSSFKLWIYTIITCISFQLFRLFNNFLAGFFYKSIDLDQIILQITGAGIVFIVMHLIRKNYLKRRGYDWKIRGPRDIKQTTAKKKLLSLKIKENSQLYRGKKITNKTKWN